MSDVQVTTTPPIDRQIFHDSTIVSRKSSLWEKIKSFIDQNEADYYLESRKRSEPSLTANFENLRTIDADTKNKVIVNVANCQEQLSGLDTLLTCGHVISVWALLICIVVSFIAGFRVSLIWLHTQYSISSTYSVLSLNLVTLLAYFCFFAIFLVPSLLNVNSEEVLFIWHFAVSFAYAALVFTHVFSPSKNNVVGLFPYSISVALTGNILFEFAYFAIITVFIVFGRIAIERWHVVRYPLAMLTSNLIDVLSSVEAEQAAEQNQGNGRDQQSDRIDHLEAKRKQLAGLEVASRCIQWYLPKRLCAGDVDTDIWWKEVTREIANALHDKKRWILTPKEDTQGWLARSLASTLTCFLSGNWDGLEKIKVSNVAPPRSWRSHLWHILGLIAEAITPILAFLLIQHFISLSTQVQDYAVVGLVFWVLITVAGALDPKFSDKVAAINDLIPSIK